jgi:hypothetical protein
MASTAIATVVKMMETLPEDAQDQVVNHLRDYQEEMRDNARWDSTFKRHSPSLSRQLAAPRRK